MTQNPGTDYVARQKALRAKREDEGYYTPEEVARREGQLQGGREYNARISGAFVSKVAAATDTEEADVAAFLPVYVETAARLVQAGEITLDDLQTNPGAQAMVARVASERIRRVLEENVDTILERVWDKANEVVD